MGDTIASLEQAHESLLHGNPELGLPGRPSPSLQQLYFNEPDALDPMLRDYIRLLKTWGALPPEEQRLDHPTLKKILEIAPGPMISRLNDAVRLHQIESEGETALLENLETALLALTLFLLAVEALLIFRPMVRAAVSSIEFFKAVIDGIPDPVFVQDENHRWLMVNQTFCDLLGQPNEQAIGGSNLDWDTPTENEEVLRDAQGRDRTVLIKKTTTRDPSGRNVLIGAIRDITHIRDVEKDLENSRIETIQSAKMSALGEVAAGIAHEIRNPLSVISVRAELLKEKASAEKLKPSEVYKSADQIYEMVRHVDRIVGSLKSFSRRDFNDPIERVAIAEILRDTLELTRSKAADKNVEIRAATPDLKLKAECRKTQICQVLVNLIGNSIDAVSSLDQRWVRFEAKDLGDFVELSVTDSGSGIPSELRERILEPFFTTKPAGAGTGLGLTLSRRLVEQHHGRIFIDTSCPNTRFVVQLPKRETLAVERVDLGRTGGS